MGPDWKFRMTWLRGAALAIVTPGALLVHAYGTTADFTIIQKNSTFSVHQITIKVGDRITFVNADSANHNVYSETKGSEFEILQRPGRSDAVRFSQPGSVEVQCAIHPDMRLEVQVRP
jgi:plastocyanin